jgi:hypothetical protein
VTFPIDLFCKNKRKKERKEDRKDERKKKGNRISDPSM